MTDVTNPVGWRVSVARTGTYAKARTKPELRDFATEAEAKAYAAEMKAKGCIACVTPRFEKPYRRGARRRHHHGWLARVARHSGGRASLA